MTTRSPLTVCAPIVASFALYLASLGIPALLFANHEPVSGATTLIWGWFGLLSFDLPWLANPLYFVAVVLASRSKHSASQVCCAIALGVGLLSFRVRHWYFNEGSATPIEKLGPAFYFWMASFAVLLVLQYWGRGPETRLRDMSSNETSGTA